MVHPTTELHASFDVIGQRRPPVMDNIDVLLAESTYWLEDIRQLGHEGVNALLNHAAVLCGESPK